MKSACLRFRIIIFLLFTFPLITFADPFIGEGKQAYIKRCISTSEMPEYSITAKEKFCKCFADKLGKGYQEVLESTKPNDSMAVAQQKMDNMAQRFAKECSKEW
jgi:hypothetical protein